MNDAQSDPAPASSFGRVTVSRKSFLRQILLLVGPYWNCERCTKARSATLLLFLLTMGQVAISVWSNYWQRALFDVLEQRSVRGVLIQIGVFSLIFIISILVTGAHLIVKRWLQLDWRAWLTNFLINSWMEGGCHYRLSFTPGEHDNPDQRIAEDIRIFTESAVALGHTLVYSLMSLFLFINILWSVSGVMSVPGTTVHMRGFMVPLAFIYAALGSLVGWMIGRPLVRATNALQTAEATFRFGLSQVRESAEEIALLRGEPLERARSSVRFSQVVRQWNRQSLAFMGLVAFGTGYGTLLPVFPILVAAPQYIKGAMTLGVLMQAAQAFQKLTSALSWPVDNIGEIARCRASADRVLSLYEAVQQLHAEAQSAGGSRIIVEQSERSRLVIEDLCIVDPSGESLLEHFNLDIRRGERVLITGDAEVTGSLFKVIGGLWPWGSGRVRLPADGGGLLFVTQRPFLPEGSLREVLCYPHAPENFPNLAVRRSLECAGVAWLAPRLDERTKWDEVLTLRAQQRLGFARVLLLRPALVFMEEATDAFDVKGEQLILEMLRHELPNTTLLNISFHPGLSHLHNQTLVLSKVRPTTKLSTE